MSCHSKEGWSSSTTQRMRRKAALSRRGGKHDHPKDVGRRQHQQRKEDAKQHHPKRARRTETTPPERTFRRPNHPLGTVLRKLNHKKAPPAGCMRVVCVVSVYCCFCRWLQYMWVTGHNTGVNDCRCAGGFVRVRGKCLGAVGSPILEGCEKCEVNKNGKRSDCGLFDNNCAGRDLSKEQIVKMMKITLKTQIMIISFIN